MKKRNKLSQAEPPAARPRLKLTVKAKAVKASVKPAKTAGKPAKDLAQPIIDRGIQLSIAERRSNVNGSKPLTNTEIRFIDEYMKDPNGTKAYMLAKPGATEASAAVSATRMLRNAKVIAEIEIRRAARSERLQIDGDAVVTEAYLIATADMRELVEYRYLCCRCCYGKDFRYQRTQGERKSAFDKHEALQDDWEAKFQNADKHYTRKVFDEKGGTGFDATKEPHADCPECIGHGVGTVVIKDTKTFSRTAIALYAGVKQTKDGLEVKAHSKLDAIEKVMRHLGLYEVDNRQQNDAARIPTEVLDALYAKAMAAAAESKRQMIERSKRLLADEARER